MSTKSAATKYLKSAYGPTTEKLRAEQAARNGSGIPAPPGSRYGGVPVPDSPINRAMREERRRAQAAAENAADAAIAEYSRRSAAVKALKDKALETWVAGGGSVIAFEKKWPELHREILARRVVEGE